jgi:hypothetical protein
MRLPWLGTAALAIWLVTGGVAAAACSGATVLFQDNFDSLQPSWGDASDWFKVENGQLVISPRADDTIWVANSAGLYDDVDLCATLTTVTGVTPDEAKAGLIFWYVDVNNFYVFELAPNGKASVWRRQRGKWLAQVKWTDAPGAVQGDGAVNDLQVTTVGGEASFFVNGQEFKKVTGSPPENGQGIGVFAGSPAAGPARFAFDNLKVTKPSP